MSVKEIEQKLFSGASSFSAEEVALLLNTIRILKAVEAKKP